MMKGIQTRKPNVIELGVGTFSKSFRSKLGTNRRCYKYFLMTSRSVVVASSVCFEKWLLLLRGNESKLRLEEGLRTILTGLASSGLNVRRLELSSGSKNVSSFFFKPDSL